MEFTLGQQDLGFHDVNMKFVVEPGRFDVWVGPHAAQGLQGSFTLTE